MRASLLLIAIALLTAGCKPGATASTPEGSPGTPEKPLSWYEKTRSGTFQLGAVLSTIQEAYDGAETARKAAKGQAASEWADVVDALDTAGASLEPHVEFKLNVDEFDRDFAAQDEKRLKAIEAANDSLHPLAEAAEMLGQMNDAKTVLELVELADHDLREAIETLGGKVDSGPDDLPH